MEKNLNVLCFMNHKYLSAMNFATIVAKYLVFFKRQLFHMQLPLILASVRMSLPYGFAWLICVMQVCRKFPFLLPSASLRLLSALRWTWRKSRGQNLHLWWHNSHYPIVIIQEIWSMEWCQWVIVKGIYGVMSMSNYKRLFNFIRETVTNMQ